MAFSTVSFTGPIVNVEQNFTWCSATPTKAYIMYTGWTGAAVGQGIRKLFIQAVYFNGKNAPTFGPACAVYNIPHTGHIVPSMCVLGDGRILASVGEGAGTSYSYYVFDVDSSDRISYAFKTGTAFTPLFAYNGYSFPALEWLSGNKAISSHPAGRVSASSTENNYQLIEVGETGFTFTTVAAGRAPTMATPDTTTRYQGITQQAIAMFRKDRNGKVMGIKAYNGATYSISSQQYQPFSYAFTSFDDQGAVVNSASDSNLKNKSLAGQHDKSGLQKARDCLPLSSNSLLSIGAPDSAGDGTMINSSTGRGNFVKITLSGIQTNDADADKISASTAQAWRDTSSIMFQDVIWLDNEYFFALARAGAQANDDLIVNYGWESALSQLRAEKVYIGKYNESTDSIILGDAAPLALPLNVGRYQGTGKYLHRISNTEVAILQLAQSEDATAWEINITVVGA